MCGGEGTKVIKRRDYDRSQILLRCASRSCPELRRREGSCEGRCPCEGRRLGSGASCTSARGARDQLRVRERSGRSPYPALERELLANVEEVRALDFVAKHWIPRRIGRGSSWSSVGRRERVLRRRERISTGSDWDSQRMAYVVDLVLKVARVSRRRQLRNEGRSLQMDRLKVDPAEPRMGLDRFGAMLHPVVVPPRREESTLALADEDGVGARDGHGSARTESVLSLADEVCDEVLSFARDSRARWEAERCPPVDDLGSCKQRGSAMGGREDPETLRVI